MTRTSTPLSGAARRRSTGRTSLTTSFALEALLWLLIAWIAVQQIIRPLIGPGLLGIGNGPYFGAPLTVDATLTYEAAGAPTTALPGLLVGGPFPRGEYIETSDPVGFTISIFQPMTFRQATGLVGGAVLLGLVGVLVLALFVRMVRDLRRGELFGPQNQRRLVIAALLLGVVGTAAEVLMAWGRIGVLQADRLGGAAVLDWTMSLNPLLFGVVLLVAAEAIRQGTRTRADTRP